MKKLLLFLSVLIGLIQLSCKNESATQAVVISHEGAPIEFNWQDDFQDGIGEFWIKQLAEDDRALIIKDPTDASNQVLKVTLLPDDKTNGGHRSEFLIKAHDSLGYLNNYSFRFMLPKIFFKKQDKNGWYLIHQWHDEPAAGYSWGSNKHKTKPPIALTISYTPEDGYRLIYKQGLDTGNLKEVVRFIWPLPLEADVWYTFENQVLWSVYPTHGYSEPRLNGQLFELYNGSKDASPDRVYGRNMYNSKGNYYKFGLYQGSGEIHTRHIYFDDFIMESKRVSYWFE
jgi:hypothetical protein